jgi:hypothetical protein
MDNKQEIINKYLPGKVGYGVLSKKVCCMPFYGSVLTEFPTGNSVGYN